MENPSNRTGEMFVKFLQKSPNQKYLHKNDEIKHSQNLWSVLLHTLALTEENSKQTAYCKVSLILQLIGV